MRVRLTARTRLTTVFTVLFLIAGSMVVASSYLLTARSVRERGDQLALVTTGPGDQEQVPWRLVDIVDTTQRQALHDQLLWSAVALAVTTAVLAGMAWLTAGRLLRPIKTMTATARRISVDDLSERVQVGDVHDEISDLAETINRMLDRIHTSIAERQRLLDSHRLFAANAAHELRTPLATMRTAIDVTLAGEPTPPDLRAMAATITRAVDHSQRTIDGLFALARSEAGPTTTEAVDLAAVTVDVLGALTKEQRRRRITTVTNLRPARLDGDPTLLRQLVRNLVDNATRHNHQGGTVSIDTTTDGTTVLLRVTNTGPHLDPADFHTLLLPFQRGTGTRTASSGVGLGLTIVNAITTAHHGTLRCQTRAEGGLEVTVCLPTAANDQAHSRTDS